MDETRSSLLHRVRDLRDRDGWREFDLFYRPMLVRYARARGLDTVSAEEIAQQCLTSIVKQISAFERQRSFRGWLRRMVDHKVADFFASRSRQGRAGAVALQNAPDAPPEPSEIWETQWNETHLQTLLTELRNSFAEHTLRAFELYVLSHYDVAEIGRVLDMTPNQIYVAKSRVITHIKKNFGDMLDSLYGVWP